MGLDIRRYWYDFEFVEMGPNAPILPLSIGIVGDTDEQNYYRQLPWHLGQALQHDWVRKNVIPRMQHLLWTEPENLAAGENILWKGNLTICSHPNSKVPEWDETPCPWLPGDASLLRQELEAVLQPGEHGLETWGYYADYDHVLLAQCFGVMVQLPKQVPMWTRDLKQLAWMLGNPRLPAQADEGEHHALLDAKHNRFLWQWLREKAQHMSKEELADHILFSMGLR